MAIFNCYVSSPEGTSKSIGIDGDIEHFAYWNFMELLDFYT